MNYDFELDNASRNSLSLLINRIKPNSTVLEFGPASGRMTQYLKEELSCKVYGVEIDEDSAKKAREYAQKICVGNIEDYTWKDKFKGIKFDFIVFADVLEHLYNPENVLNNIKEFLKEDGAVLISVPNIAHSSIIINLMKNEFNYSKTGLLDNTHIKFYTKKTFDELIKKCSYFKSYETAVYTNPANTEFENRYNELPTEVGNFLSTLPWSEFYQLVFELKKHEVSVESDFTQEYKNYGTYFIQLFVDTGNGFNEEESMRIGFQDQKEISFNLSKFKKIKKLRFDPIDDYSFVKIDEIKIDGLDYTNEIVSNAFHTRDDIYYFENNDPQLYLDVEDQNEIQTVSIKIEYLCKGEESLSDIPNVYKDIINTQSESLQQQTKKLDEQSKKLEEQSKSLHNQAKIIEDKTLHILHQNSEIINLNETIIILNEIAQSLRIKNRIKKLLPTNVKNILRSLLFKYRVYSEKYKKFKSLGKANGYIFTLKQLYKSRLYKSKALSFAKTDLNVDVVETIKDKMSIVIPTYNGLSDLVKLIPQLINQKGFDSIEIVIIDSSSSDGTKEFIEKFDLLTFITIEQKDFSHSYARNLGYEKSTGDYVLFLVQDALPESEMWLYNFYTLHKQNNLTALSCTQMVNAEADLYTCYGIDNFNKFLGISEKITKITEKFIDLNVSASRNLAQLDNVACMFKSSEFEQYKFQGKYAEDLDIGLRLIKDNKRIGITSEISVIHSHLRSSYYYMKRALVETDVLNDIFEQQNNSDININNELSDIYTAFCLVGNLLHKLKKINTLPISIDDLKVYTLENMNTLINIEYSSFHFSEAHLSISTLDTQLADTINEFHQNNVTQFKGDLYYSVHHLVHECLGYVEQRYNMIDEKIFDEFCLFILKIFATNVGSKLGAHKKEYEQSDIFIAQLIKILEKGI